MEKCAWCGRRSLALEEIRVPAPEWYLATPKETLFHVHPRHREAFRRYKAYEARWSYTFLMLIFAPLLVIVPSSLAGSAAGVALGILSVGLIIFVFPFATTTTQRALGVRWSMFLVRAAALIPVVGAIDIYRNGL